MIAYLKGELFSKHDEQVVVVANNVGYAVDLPPGVSSQLPDPGQEVELHTHYYLRDNEVKLFGFCPEINFWFSLKPLPSKASVPG